MTENDKEHCEAAQCVNVLDASSGFIGLSGVHCLVSLSFYLIFKPLSFCCLQFFAGGFPVGHDLLELTADLRMLVVDVQILAGSN